MKFVNTQAQREEWPDEFTVNVFMSYSYWTMEEEEITVEIEKDLLIQRFTDSLSIYYQAVENFEIPEITQEIWPRIDVSANINGVEWTGFADVQLYPGQTVSVEIELFPELTSQNIVINEVLYDPSGADTGYEWIELYNAGEQAVNLNGWIIQKAGTSFDDVFTFPSIIIEPDSFFLVGEEFVPNANITTSLAFQNSGTSTDGIRIVSADAIYTDTVLYDSPNYNNLPDDISSPGQYFAPDVDEGNSLARKYNGEDSNNCELDFFECENPTPGEPNFYPIDLALYGTQLN